MPDIRKRLASHIGRVRPHLERDVRAAEYRSDLHTGWSAGDLRGDRIHRADTLLTVVRKNGGQAFAALQDEVAQTLPARRYWGRESRDVFIERSLELASLGTSPDMSADALLRDLEATPPSRRLGFRTYGLAPDHAVHVAGVGFWFRGDAGLESEIHGAAITIQQISGGRPIYNHDGLAIVTVLGDGERAVRNALVRVRIALAVLACVTVARPTTQDEVDFGLGDTDYGEALWLDDKYVSTTDGDEDQTPRAWMYAAQAEVDEQIRLRPGLQSLVALAEETPIDDVSASKLDLRILRALSAIAVSFSGPRAERLLWRWIALEALLGEGHSEIVERLSDNLAVLTCDEPADRPQRKREIKGLYDIRSAVAHGGSLRALDDDSVADQRSLALLGLERVAAARDLRSFDRLRHVLEMARFEAVTFAEALEASRLANP